MSNKAQWDNDTPTDPYAGQYPPPPPLPGERQSFERQSHERQSYDSAPHEPFYLIEPINGSSSSRNQSHDNRSSSLPASLHSRYSYPDQSRISDSINRQANNVHTGHYYEYEDHEQRVPGEYYDPEAMNLKEYLEAEREEKLRKQHQKRYSTSSSARISNSSDPQVIEQIVHQHPPPQPEPYYNNGVPPFFHPNEEPYPPNMASPVPMPPPMMMSPNQSFNQPNFMVPPTLPFAYPHHQNSSNSQISNPPFGIPNAPLPPPFDEKYNNARGCCGNISFCGWFRTLILCIIFFAGIGLVIASKVLSDQCQSCSDDTCRSSTTCTDVFHAGFLYGGIVIAGLSVLVIVWRILKWLCAGR